MRKNYELSMAIKVIQAESRRKNAAPQCKITPCCHPTSGDTLRCWEPLQDISEAGAGVVRCAALKQSNARKIASSFLAHKLSSFRLLHSVCRMLWKWMKLDQIKIFFSSLQGRKLVLNLCWCRVSAAQKSEEFKLLKRRTLTCIPLALHAVLL